MSAVGIFASGIKSGVKLFERRDDDGFDRLSNRYSVGMILVMAGFIGVRTYTGEPIACMPPREYSFFIPWRRFMNSLCWTMDTYYVSFDKNIVAEESYEHDTSLDRYSGMVQYYQWSPFLLFFCAITFAIPASVWDWASNYRGYEVAAMVKETTGISNLNPEVRDKTVQYLIAHMDRLLGYRRALPKKGILKGLKVGKRHGSFLFLAYLFTKLLYIANAVGLVFILNAFIGEGYSHYGLDVLKELQDPDFKGSRRFPYSVLCDFWLRTMGENVQRYTIQCVIPANLFNERCYMVLWFWLWFVAGASFIGLIMWAFTAIPAVNRGFAQKYLTIMGRADIRDEELLKDFVHNYLRLDGIFCMRLIIKNTNDGTGGEIFAACWDHFLHTRRPPTFDATTSELLPGRRADDTV